MAMSTLSAGISGIDPTGNDTSVIGLILGILEYAPFHPECSLGIPASAVLFFNGSEIIEVLKHQNGCFMLLGKLNNASACEMSCLFIHVPDFIPEVSIILFTLCNDASLVSVACDAS